MRRPLLTLLACAVVALSALPATAGEGGKTDAFTTEGGPEGVLIHRESGFRFPARLGTFARLPDPHQFDAAGTDVSVGYNSAARSVIATLFVYPAGDRTLAQELIVRQKEVETAHPGFRKLDFSEMEVTPRRVKARSVTYSFEGQFGKESRALQSLLVVAQCGGNFVEYRFTYPAADHENSESLARKFAQTFAWP